MMCKYYNKNGMIFILIIGILSLVFGLVSIRIVPDDAHSLSMLAGMFTGAGVAFIGISLFHLIKRKLSSPEKLKKDEIKRKDERNIQISRTASVAAYLGAIILFGILAFVFAGLGYMQASFIAIGAMYVDCFVYFIAYRLVSLKI